MVLKLNKLFWRRINNIKKIKYRCYCSPAALEDDSNLSKKTPREKKPPHPFDFHSDKLAKSKFAEKLKAQQLYNEDGLIALNKPYGMRVSKSPDNLPSEQSSLHHGGYYDNLPTFDDLLPILNEIYGKKLLFISAPERWSSGVMLLGKNENSKTKTKKCIKRSLAMDETHKNYLIVSIGSPQPTIVDKKVAIKMESVDKMAVPLIKEDYSKGQMTRGDVKVARIKHKILQSSDVGLSLVDVNVYHVHRHFLRIWMAHCAAPILGDFLYGGRVRHFMGKPVVFSPKSHTAYQPPTISTEVMNRLRIQKEFSLKIPCHIHFNQLVLRMFYGKKDLTITAPVPDYFKWTCEQFGLQIPADENTPT